jgi:hypothetical protein
MSNSFEDMTSVPSARHASTSGHENGSRTKLPACITLSPTFRFAPEIRWQPHEVVCADDLPWRLYLGDIDPDSFVGDANGWRVEYRDAAPDTGIALEYRPAENLLRLNQRYRGAEVSTYASAKSTWRQLTPLAYPGLATHWEAKVRDELEPHFNLRVISGGPDTPCVVGLPDGAFMAVVCPVPVLMLRAVPLAFAAMDQDASIAAVVAGHLSLALTVVNYAEGRCPGIPDAPDRLYYKALIESGLSPIEVPIWETGKDGTRALTLRRVNYLLVVTCTLRDVTRVVGHLAEAGLIARGSGRSEGYPDAPEYGALVMPSSNELTENFWFTDAAASRRVFFPRITTMERMHAIKRRVIENHRSGVPIDPGAEIAAAELYSEVALGSLLGEARSLGM